MKGLLKFITCGSVDDGKCRFSHKLKKLFALNGKI